MDTSLSLMNMILQLMGSFLVCSSEQLHARVKGMPSNNTNNHCDKLSWQFGKRILYFELVSLLVNYLIKMNTVVLNLPYFIWSLTQSSHALVLDQRGKITYEEAFLLLKSNILCDVKHNKKNYTQNQLGILKQAKRFYGPITPFIKIYAHLSTR